MHQEFINRASEIFETDEQVIGLAIGGSWRTNEMDEFSDLDFVLVTKTKLSGNKELMIDYAKRIGDFLSGFTGEHVGEPRLLICLFDNPLLHVDIKFLTLEEFSYRVEDPVIHLDKKGALQNAISRSAAKFPYPDYQWIEDRFWTWIHYTLLKIGRGEYLEAVDFFSFLRMTVFGPLLHIKNGNLPRGVRRIETQIEKEDFDRIKLTIPTYNRIDLLKCLKNAVSLYRALRNTLFDNKVVLRTETEEKVLLYFDKIEKK